MNQIIPATSEGGQLAKFKSPTEVRDHFATLIRQQVGGKKILFGVSAALGIALLSPLIIKIAEAGFGAAVIAVLLVGAGVARKWLPNLFLQVENRIFEANHREKLRHLSVLKAQARANPIEQRENSLQVRQRQLAAVKEVLQKIYGKMESWASRLEERKKVLKKQGKTEDLSKEEEAVAKIRDFYTRRKGRWEEGMKACEDQKEFLESLRFKWEFAKEGGELSGELDPAAEEAFLNDRLDEEAAKEVETRFNSVFALIDLDISEINTGKQLSFDGNVIDISGIHIPTVKEFEHV